VRLYIRCLETGKSLLHSAGEEPPRIALWLRLLPGLLDVGDYLRALVVVLVATAAC
jgi:hypothetical protein